MISSWLLLAAFVQDAAPTATPPAAAAQAQPANPLIAELASKFASLEQAKNYAFVVETESSGGGGRNREGDAAGAQPRPPVTVHARYQSGQPMELKQGEDLSYLSGDVLVHKNAEGVWEKVERGGRGPRPEGGAPPKADDTGAAKPPEAAGAGAGAGEGRGPGGRGGMGGMQNLRSVIAPHKLVEGFAGKVKDVAKAEKDGKTVYSGALTDAAASQLSAMGGRRNRGGGGGEGPQLTNTGSFEIVFAADGSIESIRIDSMSSGTFGDRTVEMKRKSTYRISDLGKVEVKVPEEAAKLFEA